jgi:hypothetical protein
MLSDAALALIRDVFRRPTLLSGSPRIQRRVTAWGTDPVAVPHAAIVVSEVALIEALPMPAAPETAAPADFIIEATRSPQLAPPHRFGSRRAAAAEVRLKSAAENASCWIEALEAGWLFLVSGAEGASWLLGVGDGLEDLLSGSRLIAPLIDDMHAYPGTFDACPRMAPALHSENWLLCGTAAIAFDPICGDGAAQAVREAILASAVVIGMTEGGDAAQLKSHYQSMLIAAMRRHLKLCADFYRTGGKGAWWDAELRALIDGHNWCTEQLARAPEPRYRLSGLRLVAREE